MARDLGYAARTIRRLLRQLDQPEELENTFAEAVLAQAVRNAAARPTPQARMAAANLVVEQATIGPASPGAPAEVAIGSEFGSSRYPQFHRPPTSRGYWLYPAVDQVVTQGAMDRELEKMLRQVIRG